MIIALVLCYVVTRCKYFLIMCDLLLTCTRLFSAMGDFVCREIFHIFASNVFFLYGIAQSEISLFFDLAIQSANDSSPTSETARKPRRQSSQRGGLKCISSVLCASSPGKSRRRSRSVNRGNGEGDGSDRRPLSPSRQQSPISQESGPMTTGSPSTTPGDSQQQQQQRQFSRTEKVHTLLRLPDGREFSLPICVDLALNLILNSFDRSENIELL